MKEIEKHVHDCRNALVMHTRSSTPASRILMSSFNQTAAIFDRLPCLPLHGRSSAVDPNAAATGSAESAPVADVWGEDLEGKEGVERGSSLRSMPTCASGNQEQDPNLLGIGRDCDPSGSAVLSSSESCTGAVPIEARVRALLTEAQACQIYMLQPRPRTAWNSGGGGGCGSGGAGVHCDRPRSSQSRCLALRYGVSCTEEKRGNH